MKHMTIILALALCGCATKQIGTETRPLRLLLDTAKADIAGARADGKAIKRILSRSDYKADLILRFLQENP